MTKPKLSDYKVALLRRRAWKIRRTPKAKGFIRDEATRLGVHPMTVCQAVYGDTWKEAPERPLPIRRGSGKGSGQRNLWPR